jgi:hypothetical protein
MFSGIKFETRISPSQLQIDGHFKVSGLIIDLSNLTYNGRNKNAER